MMNKIMLVMLGGTGILFAIFAVIVMISLWM
ncbi:hypothetical protein ABIC15_002377 [Exiguobacterium sp. PvP048]